MRSILFDLRTGEVFSEKLGWNNSEASIRDSGDWSGIIYHCTSRLVPVEDGKWRDRDLLILVPLPREPEILT